MSRFSKQIKSYWQQLRVCAFSSFCRRLLLFQSVVFRVLCPRPAGLLSARLFFRAPRLRLFRPACVCLSILHLFAHFANHLSS